MEFINTFHMGHWDSSFYAEDCSNATLIFFGVTNIKTYMWLVYATFAMCSGFMYGRHKGIDPYREFDVISQKGIYSKLIELATQTWFIVSIFIFPWYLCTIGLYYAIHFNDIHYINAYNPWILAIIVIYMLYSITIVASFAYYSDKRNLCSAICIRVIVVLYGLLTLFTTYILMKNRNNNLSLSLKGFYGNKMLYCIDYDSHKNPILLSIFVILYIYGSHHIFVFLRAFAAKFCGGHYLSEAIFENEERPREIQKKHRNNAHIYDKNDGENEENEFKIDIDQQYITDADSEHVDTENDDGSHFNDYYMRNRSGSRQNDNNKRSPYVNEPNVETPELQLLNIASPLEFDLSLVDPPQAYHCV